MDPSEHAIQLAIQEFNSGIFKSRRAAAKAYGVSESTLRNRINGASNSQTSHAHQQRLSPDQESFLVEWILEQDMNYYPPSHARAREMAIRILQSNGDFNPLGRHWLSQFIRRNPRISSIIGRKLDNKRAKAANQEQIQAFFKLFQ